MKILVIGPSWVGDMMMSQSLYRTLKQQYPDASIDVMAPGWCRPLLSRMPEVNQAIAMPIGHGSFQLLKRRQLGLSLEKNHYDRAYVLPNSFKSALIPFFAGIKQRIGWRGEMRYGLLNERHTLDKMALPLMVQRYVALAYSVGEIKKASDLPQPILWPQLSVSQDEILAVSEKFSMTGSRPIIGFCPGAEFGPAKRWPHYHYAALAKHLIDAGHQIALFGSVKDREAGEEILRSLSTEQQQHCHNLAGNTSLDEAVVLLASCQSVISNDSGLMHIAAALQRPLIALYGPTSPDFTPPLANNARVIRLISGYHKIRKGSAEQGYHQSLIDITPERVIDELKSLMSSQQETECAS